MALNGGNDVRNDGADSYYLSEISRNNKKIEALKIRWVKLNNLEEDLIVLAAIYYDNNYFIECIYDQFKIINNKCESYKSTNKVPMFDELFDFTDLIGESSNLKSIDNDSKNYRLVYQKICDIIDNIQTEILNSIAKLKQKNIDLLLEYQMKHTPEYYEYHGN